MIFSPNKDINNTSKIIVTIYLKHLNTNVR